MPISTPDFQAIRDAILRDIANQPRPDGQQPNVSADGDYFIRANATGAAIEGLYQRLQWIKRQIFADEADDDFVEHHASLRGLFRKAATVASGTITFSGTVGSNVPIGTEAKTADGVAFLTTATGNVGGGGTVTLAAQASAADAAGNQMVTTPLTLTAAPAGIVSTASIAGMTGGTDRETVASLLSRLLFVLRNPPCGGALHDYYTWAMNVPGVTRAYPYACRRHNGSVDVAILTAGGMPDAPLIAAVQAYIDTQRPATADALVLAPTGVAVNFSADLVLAASYVRGDVGDVINPKLAAYFDTFKPGDTFFLKKASGIISDTAGVVDFTLASPLANVATLVDATHIEMPVLGTTSWT